MYVACVCIMCACNMYVDMYAFQTHQKNNFHKHSRKHCINSIQYFLLNSKCYLWYQPNCSYFEAIEVENYPRTYHNECCQDEYLKSGQVNYTKSSGEELSHMYTQVPAHVHAYVYCMYYSQSPLHCTQY